MKIIFDGTPKEIAQMLQVLQIKQPQIAPGAEEKLEDSIAKGIRPSAKLDSYGVTTDRIADHGITYDRLAGRPAEEEQR